MLLPVSVNIILTDACGMLGRKSLPGGRDMARKRLAIVIDGRVQGVWFRASTHDEAIRLGLQGWVRNLPDGRVEAELEGEEDALRRMLAWCRAGPPGSRVDHAEARWSTATNEFETFSIRS